MSRLLPAFSLVLLPLFLACGDKDDSGDGGAVGLDCAGACQKILDCGLFDETDMNDCVEHCDETSNADFVECIDENECATMKSCESLIPS